jgi:hypothetical protein
VQGREALDRLMAGSAFWPPVVVPFGLDPFGWHGAHESYHDICAFALERCTLLPKVQPVRAPLYIGGGDASVWTDEERAPDGSIVRRHTLSSSRGSLMMEEVRTPGDSSWKTRRRWIENDGDLEFFLGLDLSPAEPDLDTVREKERAVGFHGLPYVEIGDPFYTVCEMFSTDSFFIRTLNDTERIKSLIASTSERVIHAVESLCRDAGCPFILRFIGAEMAAPPFLSRESFLQFEGDFYRKAAKIVRACGVPASFHCHGPVRGIMNDIWEMGYSFIEPFEPPPRGDVTIAEALALTRGRGVVFGGVDEVLFTMGTTADISRAVTSCLDGARGTGAPYILSQSATPFYEPLTPEAGENILLFMELGARG